MRVGFGRRLSRRCARCRLRCCAGRGAALRTSYDWRDGIGPAAKRPARTGFWGQQDSNRYGLHEFMRTCRAIGCKPYLAADLRALPARDFYQEIEYCNAPAGDVPSNSAAKAVPNALAAERAANGDPAPFNVDLWGVGNETLGLRRQHESGGVCDGVSPVHGVDAELQQDAAAFRCGGAKWR